MVFDRISQDCGTVVSDSSEQVVGSDTDTYRDVYQRSRGTRSSRRGPLYPLIGAAMCFTIPKVNMGRTEASCVETDAPGKLDPIPRGREASI